MEEDELFQVQGKPEGSHWSLSLTLAEVQMHATVNSVIITLGGNGLT